MKQLSKQLVQENFKMKNEQKTIEDEIRKVFSDAIKIIEELETQTIGTFNEKTAKVRAHFSKFEDSLNDMKRNI